MLLGGDEFGRTQQGNNNAYCQDSDISWFDWSLGENAQKLLTFTKRVIQLRRNYPILRRSRFLTGEKDAMLNVRDAVWINTAGNEMTSGDWQTGWVKCFGLMLDGRARKTAIRHHAEDESALMILNSYEGEVDFRLPQTEIGLRWSLTLDTNDQDHAPDEFDFGSVYKVAGRSLVLFISTSDR